jgi:hypothetical protein
MRRCAAIDVQGQFSLAYLLGEIALIAVALAASRLALFPPGIWAEARAVLFCIALIAGCGAVGGLCLRMAVGLIAGGVFAVASIPLLWLVVSATSY